MMTALPTLAVKNGRKPAGTPGHGRLAAAYLAPGMLGFLVFIVLCGLLQFFSQLFDLLFQLLYPFKCTKGNG